jgi:hypothetical protein
MNTAPARQRTLRQRLAVDDQVLGREAVRQRHRLVRVPRHDHRAVGRERLPDDRAPALRSATALATRVASSGSR